MIANIQKVPANFADYQSLYPNGDIMDTPNTSYTGFPDILTPPSFQASSKTPGGSLAMLAEMLPIHNTFVPFVPKPDYTQQVSPYKYETPVVAEIYRRKQREQGLEELAREFFQSQERLRTEKELANFAERGLPPPPMGSEEVSAIRNAPNFRRKENEIREAFLQSAGMIGERRARMEADDANVLAQMGDENDLFGTTVDEDVAEADEDIGPEGGGYERKEGEGDEVKASSSSKGKRGRKTAASMGEETKAQIKKRESEENRFAIQQGRPIPYPDRLSITNKLKFGIPLTLSEQLKLAERKKR